MSAVVAEMDVTGARVVVGAGDGKADHALAVRQRRYGWPRNAVAGERHLPLPDHRCADLAGGNGRIQYEVGNACLLLAGDIDRGIERSI